MPRRDEIAVRLVAERARQFNLPGMEFDVRHAPNDWISIVAHYLFEEVNRGRDRPTRLEFEDCLCKAGAVIIAALEHCDQMQQSGKLV